MLKTILVYKYIKLNGAGKTTLLNILNAYEPNTAGQLTLFGMQPGKKGYSVDNVRHQIGFVSNSLMDRAT